MIKYKQGDLFDNLTGNEIIAHACNAQGVWGSGFAKQCKEKFPELEALYWRYCQSKLGTGKAFLASTEDTSILCLITSDYYGNKKDKPQEIITATRLALADWEDLTESMFDKTDEITIVSPKINSGLFGVPWPATEFLIMEFIGKSGKNIKWTVFEK